VLGEEYCWTTKLIQLTYESDRHSSKSYYRLRGCLPLGMLLWIMPSPPSLEGDSAIYAISDYNFASVTCENSGSSLPNTTGFFQTYTALFVIREASNIRAPFKLNIYTVLHACIYF
jgi:hypothetical protein